MKPILTALALLPLPAFADPAQVVDVELTCTSDTWRASVAILHPETGWDDYADGWRVELADGTILGTRVLHHPHADEQPFTRSLSGIEIPAGTQMVAVRARTSVEGWNTSTTQAPLPTC